MGVSLVKWGVWLGGLAGLGLAVWLLASYGVDRILAVLGRAGWIGIGIVVAFHLVQLACSAAAWRAIAGPSPNRPGLLGYCRLRWIREGVNNLLPVAQIGGEFVSSRLLARRGVPLVSAIAGSVADLTMEMLTQIAFTLLGLGLLWASVGGAEVEATVVTGLAVAVAVAAAFLGAQWFGLAKLMERGLLWLGRALGWSGTADVAGLHAALLDCYRNWRRVGLAATWHSLSWLLGGIEVCLALHFLGHDVGFGPGVVIESLGQALKAVGFAVPGALGVQEGGYIVVCQLFGLAPEVAIAVSIIKRIREVVLGIPGLIAWQRSESGRVAAA